MLVTKTKITDCQLEPNDKTKLVVTVQNSSPVATANDVEAFATLQCGNVKGIQLLPKSKNFGSIPPKGSATQEFEICTTNANPNKYRVLFRMKYQSEVPANQCGVNLISLSDYETVSIAEHFRNPVSRKEMLIIAGIFTLFFYLVSTCICQSRRTIWRN